MPPLDSNFISPTGQRVAPPEIAELRQRVADARTARALAYQAYQTALVGPADFRPAYEAYVGADNRYYDAVRALENAERAQ